MVLCTGGHQHAARMVDKIDSVQRGPYGFVVFKYGAS